MKIVSLRMGYWKKIFKFRTNKKWFFRGTKKIWTKNICNYINFWRKIYKNYNLKKTIKNFGNERFPNVQIIFNLKNSNISEINLKGSEIAKEFVNFKGVVLQDKELLSLLLILGNSFHLPNFTYKQKGEVSLIKQKQDISINYILNQFEEKEEIFDLFNK